MIRLGYATEMATHGTDDLTVTRKLKESPGSRRAGARNPGKTSGCHWTCPGSEALSMGKKPGSPLYSVLVPVYESDSSVVELVERLSAVFEKQLRTSYEVILVDDGSQSPSTWPTCERLAREFSGVIAIRLMRNYGKAHAILCGLKHVSGRYVITIDDDLQQRPEDIPALVQHQEHDVIVANFVTRRHRRLTILSSWTKGLFDRVILGLPCRMSPLKLFKAEVAEAMLKVRTSYPFIPALMAHGTSDFFPVDVQHEKSRHGKSRFTLRRRIKQLSNLLINNSTLLLRTFAFIGGLVALSGFAYAASIIFRRLLGAPPQPGWTSLVVINLVFGGLILIALGIVGEYLIRILEGISNKPPYRVRQIATSKGRSDGKGRGDEEPAKRGRPRSVQSV